MSQIIDRRPNNRHKSAVNRTRFLKRFKKQIREAVSDAVAKRSITDFERGEQINIPRKDIHEPSFHHTSGGRKNIVFPGNKSYAQGDKIKRHQTEAEQQDTTASNQGEGEDEFVFKISSDEFLEVFFDDLELPFLVKKQISQIVTDKLVKAGHTRDGVPTNINIIRSMRNSLARRIAMGGDDRRKLRELNNEFNSLKNKSTVKANKIKDEIDELKQKLAKIPFLDPFDLRYNYKTAQPAPTSKAVVFCLMDVSGSMDETKKDIAKRFFILLYLFLKRNYDKIELVFIRHHTSAKEVDEQEFFYSRETGGTVVSSALELMYKIQQDRYPKAEWNIYGAQASDGDNWNNDSPRCKEVLNENIMPHVQYFAYVEIMPRHHQSLWESYEDVKASNPNFSMQSIADLSEIYPVFRELFKRQPEVSAE